MAIERDSPSNLICMYREYTERIAIRKAIIEEFPEKSHGYMHKGVDSIHEIYSYLTETYLPARAILFDPRAILRALGEIVQEDLFLPKQDPENSPHRLVAFVCCCSSGFDPSEKLGLSLRDIHAPVPSYDKIGASMERFFSRLETGKNVKRTKEINCETSFARIERQTLSRLPRIDTVMFFFKTYLYPLRDIKAEGLGPKLAESIEGLKAGNSPGMWKYKGSIRWGKSVCEYMRS
ncbi:hypothetical protein Cpir12675_003757 [Ceratocystis pirilliformis]|uniref:Uncharacterized protein n=1 Tax=Ceratocystis pirilliformis TaxID=259994 RepID=A0ABR3Z0W8_9PEZI